MSTGRIHSFETLGTLDGPGVRYVAFFSGCPLRCKYCHNPDTWELSSGAEMEAEDVIKKVLRYRPYFKNGGGITLSGGEPLLQPDFAGEILQGCKKEGVSTCVDTAGSVLNNLVKAALSNTDLVILDVKHTDPQKFHELTGGELSDNRVFLDYCITLKIPLWIRQVIVPGFNSTPEDMKSLLDYIRGANVQKVELLPYHTLGIRKWKALGLSYPLEGISPPPAELMDNLYKCIHP